MKHPVSSFLYGAGFALLLPAIAQAATPGPGPQVMGHGTEEVVCIGPGSITGTVVDAQTIITPRFSAYRCMSHYPVPIKVQFKDPAVVMKAGDTVTLKGRLIDMQDAHRKEYGLVLKDAELAQ